MINQFMIIPIKCMKVSHGNYTVGLFSILRIFVSVDDDDETIRIDLGRGGVDRPSIS